MGGFKKFLLQGDLVALAVAFVIGAAFATVVKAFVDVFMGLIGKAGGHPDFNSFTPGGLPVGAFITAVVAFVIIAAVVYFFVVVPYTKAKDKYFPDPAAGASSEDLLAEIRDILASKN